MLIQWRRCQQVISTDGMTFDVMTDDGKSVKYVAQRPEVGIANRLAVQLRALEGDLGLSAVARGKIDLPKTKPRLLTFSQPARDRGGKERFFH